MQSRKPPGLLALTVILSPPGLAGAEVPETVNGVTTIIDARSTRHPGMTLRSTSSGCRYSTLT